MKANTTELVKFKKLQRRLGESVRGVIGILELLWKATALQAPRGDIGKFDNEDIAILCDWEGDPDLLVSALVASGWLDESVDYRLLVHDWHEHAPIYVRAGLKAKHQTFLTPTAGAPSEAMAPGVAPETAPEMAPEGDQLSNGQTGAPSSRAPGITKPSQAKPSQVKSSVGEPPLTPVAQVKKNLSIPMHWLQHVVVGPAIDRWVGWVLNRQTGDINAATLQVEAHLLEASGKIASGRTLEEFAAAINRSIAKSGKEPYWDEFASRIPVAVIPEKPKRGRGAPSEKFIRGEV